MNGQPSRSATWEERRTWGTCPICSAPPGSPCNPSVGLLLGHPATEAELDAGVHLLRLQAAPHFVQLVRA